MFMEQSLRLRVLFCAKSTLNVRWNMRRCGCSTMPRRRYGDDMLPTGQRNGRKMLETLEKLLRHHAPFLHCETESRIGQWIDGSMEQTSRDLVTRNKS